MLCAEVLCEPFIAAGRQARALREAGHGVLGIACHLVLKALLHAFVPLENANYRALAADGIDRFPHISSASLKAGDVLRALLQVLFLAFVRMPAERLPLGRLFRMPHFGDFFERHVIAPLQRLTDGAAHTIHVGKAGMHRLPAPLRAMLWIWLTLTGASLVVLCITQPLDLTAQSVFFVLMLSLALILRRVRSHLTLLFMIVISFIVSTRYIWWRCTETLNTDTVASSIAGLLLLAAEMYAYVVMVLSYFQVSWVLDRKPLPLPEDESAWPTVDIFIPTYNEPLDVVRPTVYGALGMDWPTERRRVWILDDGSREEFKAFADKAGCGYIKRDIHNHAKAGNINHAMTLTDGELIAVFDCDHIPTRAFLQMTVGWLARDPKIALVQTPHYFYSEAPFEKNLRLDSDTPLETTLFHEFIQKGNDTWDATMFCGSCAVMRRSALEEIGGIAVETVTEDAHTSLKLNRRGWRSAFIGLPLAAGLSTESLSAHIGQRIRWARGMIQIFRLDNPLFGKGLTFGQRLCFLNAMIHFFHGLPRLIFLLAPLPFLFAGVYVIHASALALFLFVLPHMIHSTLTTGIVHRGYRNSFLSGVYESALSWYILLPTTVAVFFPRHGKFNVTVKGGTIDKTFFDWTISKPYLVLIGLNFAGLCVGLWTLFTDPTPEYQALLINLGWILYNLVVLGATLAVSVEATQARRHPRVRLSVPVSLMLDGHALVRGMMVNYSQHGLSINVGTAGAPFFSEGMHTDILIDYDGVPNVFSGVVRRVTGTGSIGIELDEMTVEEEKAFTRCTFSRADTWSLRAAATHSRQVSFVRGTMDLLRFSGYGYAALFRYAPAGVGRMVQAFGKILKIFGTYLPRVPVVKKSARCRSGL